MYGLSVLFSCRVVSKRSVRYYSSGSTKKLLEFLADMPRTNSTRILEAQRQRQQILKKTEKYGPSTVYLQVLGSGARGAPNTLYLFTDQKRYLFNCGECTQRFAHEHKVKLSRLDHIFITSKTWKNIGGLPGLSLTLQDVGVPNITLHGPEGLDDLYTATKRFVIMKDMNVTMARCSPSEDFEDNVMNVKYVLLGPNDDILTGKDLKPAAKKLKLDPSSDKEYEEFIHDDTDYYKAEIRNMEGVTNKTKIVKDPKDMVNRDKVKPKVQAAEKDAMKKKTEKVLHDLQKKTNCSVAYICTLKKRPGTLDLAKCVELGVKPGPTLGQLKNGFDVMLPDGSLVLSKDVKTPDDPGPVFIIIDVPDISYLKEMEFSAHFDNGVNPPENIPTLIVHFTPPHVFHEPAYRHFMGLFGNSTRHLVLNTQNSCLGSEAVHRTQHKLHLLDPDIFPLLRDVSLPAVWNAHPPVPKTNSPVKLKGLEELKNKIALAQFQNIINLEGSAKGDGHQPAVDDSESVKQPEFMAGRTLTMYHLRPKKQLDRSAEPKLHIQDYIQETMDVDGFVGSLEQFRHLVDSMRYAKSDSKEYPKVVFLGTGSCIPSKTRNTSAIVLHIDEDRSILLDCGEGTFGQLVRFYGPKKVNAFLRTLKAIYISHLHADHHIGLIGVLQAHRSARAELAGGAEGRPLYLLAPGQIVTWLTLYDNQFQRLKTDYTLIPNQNLLYDKPQKNAEVSSAVLAAIGVQAIQTCFVAHCPNAFGVAIDVDERFKMTYSGDTLPCEELVKIGENSTLLIHEATMEDELADEARTKMHSTTTQAIDIGRQMNARFTVLTHFSQRYARLPRLNSHILNDNNSVGIAFDNMQITMSDLRLLPHMYAPLQLMFAEHCVEMELKAAQRQRVRERRRSAQLLRPDSGHVQQQFQNGNQRVAACRTNSLLPKPHASYRESNSSRLRQENKGMAVTGIVSKPRSRSNSASTSATSDSRKRLRSTSRQRTSEVLKTKETAHSASEKRKEKPLAVQPVPEKEKPLDIAAPRSISENFSKVNVPSAKISTTSSPGVVMDIRSKPSSNVVPKHPLTGVEVMDIMSNTKKSHCPTHYGGCKTPSSGYGKPLVTHMKKRLSIRRDMPWPLLNLNESSEKLATPKVGGTRRPSRIWKAENSDASPVRAPRRPDLIRNKIPTKATVSGNKLRESNTSPNVFPDTKMPVMRNNIGVRSLRPSVSSLNRSRNSVVSKQQKSPNNAPDIMNASSVKIKRLHPREKKEWKPDTQMIPPRTPNRAKSPSSKIIKAESTRKPTTSGKDVRVFQVAANTKHTLHKDNLHTHPPRPNFLECMRRQTTPSKDVHLVDNVKQSLNKEALNAQPPKMIFSELTRRPITPSKDVHLVDDAKQALHKEVMNAQPLIPTCTAHNNRVFKPQLEDIKSSYLLLNKKAQDLNMKSCAKPGKYKSQIPLPNAFNEQMRQQKLNEVKKKFQSKRFWCDSKYEKIEGLNWITWK